MSSTRSGMTAMRLGAAALALVAGSALAQAPAQRKDVTQPELRYQAGSSPLGQAEMHQNINPKAPPMTKAEFDQGRSTSHGALVVVGFGQGDQGLARGLADRLPTFREGE